MVSSKTFGQNLNCCSLLNKPWNSSIGEFQYTIIDSKNQFIYFYNDCPTTPNVRYYLGYLSPCKDSYWFNDGRNNYVVLWDNGAVIYSNVNGYIWSFPGKWMIDPNNWVIWNFNNLTELDIFSTYYTVDTCNTSTIQTKFTTTKICDQRTYELENYNALYNAQSETSQYLIVYYPDTVQPFFLHSTSKSWNCDVCNPNFITK